LELALKIGNLGSWDVDFAKDEIIVNEQWSKVSGYKLEKATSMSRDEWLNTIHPDDRDMVLKYGADYKEGLVKEYAIEYRGIKEDGEVLWLLSTGSVTQRDAQGKPLRMVGIVRDITKDKLYKEQLQIAKTQAEETLKMKSDFLANMSHEIRTPLNAIVGFIDLLKESENDPKKLEYLNIVNTSSRDLVNIINDILDFSKIESGKLNIEYIDFDTHEEFDMSKKLFEAKANEKSIDLQILYKEVPQYLKSDILRIKQVINNLLSNAIKFTPDGKKITISIEYKHNELLVAVKDEGVGIQEDKLESIFEAFSQEELSTSRKYGGTGLGLSISSRLIQLLGGELKVKSKVGVGSVFYFQIPVQEGQAVQKDSISTASRDNLKDKKILLVEDIEINQKMMRILIEKAGMEMDVASDGLEALEKFTTQRYDCILMDENMPNMNGIQATSEILSYEKENKLEHTPIIALTANAVEGDKERFLKAGMDEYLNKPIDKEKLYNVLSSFL
jgi:PAS domain S-box-containing protein